MSADADRTTWQHIKEFAFIGYSFTTISMILMFALLSVLVVLGSWSPSLQLGVASSLLVGVSCGVTSILVNCVFSLVAGSRQTKTIVTAGEHLTQEVVAVIKDATSGQLSTPEDIFARATAILEDAEREKENSVVFVSLPSPALYQEREAYAIHGKDIARNRFCCLLAQRAKQNWPTVVCMASVEDVLPEPRLDGSPNDGGRDTIGRFHSLLAGYVASSGELGLTSKDAGKLLEGFFALMARIHDELRGRPETAHEFYLFPVRRISDQFVLWARRSGGRWYIEDWLLFLTDITWLELSSGGVKIKHCAIASKMGAQGGQSLLDGLYASVQEPNGPYADRMLTSEDALAGNFVGLPTTRSLITTQILLECRWAYEYKTFPVRPHEIGVAEFRRPKIAKGKLNYIPPLFMPLTFPEHDGNSLRRECLNNSNSALAMYVLERGPSWKGYTILEIGCAAGGVTRLLCGIEKVTVIGIDKDPVAVQLCNDNVGRNQGAPAEHGQPVQVLTADCQDVMFSADTAAQKIKAALVGTGTQAGFEAELDVVVVDLPLVAHPNRRWTPSRHEAAYIDAKAKGDSGLPTTLAELLPRVCRHLQLTTTLLVTTFFAQEGESGLERFEAAVRKWNPDLAVKKWIPSPHWEVQPGIIAVLEIKNQGHA